VLQHAIASGFTDSEAREYGDAAATYLGLGVSRQAKALSDI
jgi:hypothetical protein